MLKALVRAGITCVTLVVALTAVLSICVVQEAFPQNTHYSVGLNFRGTELTKPAAVEDLEAFADETGAYLAKFVPDPQRFYSVRDLYVFGHRTQDRARPLVWFAPGLTGSIKSAKDLGDSSLDGPYVLSNSPRAVEEISGWAHRNGVDVEVSERNSMYLVATIVASGAWLALIMALVLLVSSVIAWYAMRARGRALRVLAGRGRTAIFVEDLFSLIRLALPSAAGTIVLTTAVVAITRGPVNMLVFLAAVVPFLVGELLTLALCASIAGAFCLPRVDGIASRTPAEKPFRVVSELVRFVALLLVVASLPSSVAAVSAALSLSRSDARWAPLARDVSVRLAPGSEVALEQHFDEFSSLARAADDRNQLLLSYLLDGFVSREVGGFDGLVLINGEYLRAMGGQMGLRSAQHDPLGRAGKEVTFSQLPGKIGSDLRESIGLWTRGASERQLDDGSIRLFEYVGANPFPAIDPNGDDLRLLASPLLVLIDRPGTTLDGDFLSAAMSTSNIIFSDPVWLDGYLRSNPVGEQISFVDRVSDVALNASRTAMQRAVACLVAMAVVLLALGMATAVSARIKALVQVKRIVTLRISGHTWPRVLRAQMLIELAVVAVVTITAFAAAAASGSGMAVWVLPVLPFYGAAIVILHYRAARTVFIRKVQRDA